MVVGLGKKEVLLRRSWQHQEREGELGEGGAMAEQGEKGKNGKTRRNWEGGGWGLMAKLGSSRAKNTKSKSKKQQE